jgi:DnaJ-class molecular chaperone
MATWKDVWIGYRVKWLADEQLAGNGAVVICGACAGTGFDPDDPSDPCPVCRGPGAVLRSDLKPDIPA